MDSIGCSGALVLWCSDQWVMVWYRVACVGARRVIGSLGLSCSNGLVSCHSGLVWACKVDAMLLQY